MRPRLEALLGSDRWTRSEGKMSLLLGGQTVKSPEVHRLVQASGAAWQPIHFALRL
jgi:hypothetical protein